MKYVYLIFQFRQLVKKENGEIHWGKWWIKLDKIVNDETRRGECRDGWEWECRKRSRVWKDHYKQ